MGIFKLATEVKSMKFRDISGEMMHASPAKIQIQCQISQYVLYYCGMGWVASRFLLIVQVVCMDPAVAGYPRFN